jgi:hypothetical protein
MKGEYLDDLGVDGKTLSKRVLMEQDGTTKLMWFKIGTAVKLL